MTLYFMMKVLAQVAELKEVRGQSMTVYIISAKSLSNVQNANYLVLTVISSLKCPVLARVHCAPCSIGKQ